MSVTPSQTVGPYFAIGLIDDRWKSMGSCDARRITIAGAVLDAAGVPVIDAMLEIWQPDRRAFGRFATDPATGNFSFETSRPCGLDSGQAPHLCVGVFARGLLKRLYTRIYFSDESANESDPILALVPPRRRPTLIAVANPAGGAYRFDVRLSGPGETVFFEC